MSMGQSLKECENRGGYLWRYKKPSLVIAEPFFVDNDHNLAMAMEGMDGLAIAYSNAIDEISQVV